MKRTLWTVLAGTVWMVAGFGAFAMADSSFKTVKDRGELVVGMCAQYPPFESKNEKTGELEGFDVDMGRAIAKEMGVEARIVDAEWQGLLGGLKKGDFDILITCMSKSETREENVNFSDVYYELPDVVVVRADESEIRGSADLDGKTVGVQLGSASEQLADKMKDRFKEIRRYNYNPEAFTDLKFKRVDAVLVGYAYAVNQMKTDPSFKVVGAPLAKAEIVMVLPKNTDELTARVNEALDKIRKNGVYDEIHARWLKID